ncbi:MAG: hypothetical protein N2053_07240, partial [Chitinispirillaceae bacterium]|nr:hypothetical protein [Chitinispirillaceae bacterium]
LYTEEEKRLKEVEGELEKARAEISEMEEKRKILSENFRNTELEAQTIANQISHENNEIKRITKEISSLEERKLFTLEEKN